MKALSMFSGGLDSMLASELIRAQGVEIQAFFLKTPFFSSKKAAKSANAIRLPLKVIDITDRHLDIIKKPKYGYGENMNPCLDCHVLMLRVAGKMMEHEKAHFIITGDVLGQRPISQNRKALSIIDSESGLDGLILRPLSAKHLPPTIPETKAWVSREKMLDYSGRSRKPQIELARSFNITDYPSPAGGCLLTDSMFSRRLADIMSSETPLSSREIELLKIGRHFRIGPKTKIIVGRNEVENHSIGMLAAEDEILLNTVSIPGPTVLVTGESSALTDELAAAITASYSDAYDGEAEISLKTKDQYRIMTAKVRDKKEFRGYMI
jgi:tRNA-specific 2-thiouridylase